MHVKKKEDIFYTKFSYENTHKKMEIKSVQITHYIKTKWIIFIWKLYKISQVMGHL